MTTEPPPRPQQALRNRRRTRTRRAEYAPPALMALLRIALAPVAWFYNLLGWILYRDRGGR